MKCQICSGDNVNDAVFCAHCGAALTAAPESAPASYATPDAQSSQYYQPPQSYMPAAPDPRDKKALMGMIFGIASIPMCCISLSFPISSVYVVLAICAAMGIAGMALSIAGLKSPNKRGMAVAGLVCGIVGALLSLACIALLVYGEYLLESGLYYDILNEYYNMSIR